MNLASFRKSMGVSQEWLANKMDLTQVTISRYEQGIHKPSLSFYYHLAYIFRHTTKELADKLDGEFVPRD